MDETFINISDSANPKFVIVTGSNNKAEANIAGITPAVLNFKGRWEDSPPYILVQLVFSDNSLIFSIALSRKQ